MAKYDFLNDGIPSVLDNFRKFTFKENARSSLIALNNTKSLRQEETRFSDNLDEILFIMSLLESNTIASDVCLKILLNASKKYKAVRNKLLEKKIFYILTVRLRKETDFWKSNLVLYSALIFVLVQGNNQAQNQMRISGCLSTMVYILSCILDEENNKPVPYKNTELIVYTIIASYRNPRHFQIQTEIGWIIPKVIEYLKRQTSFLSSQQFQLVKCFWFFLKSALNRNETNQHIFLNSSGVSVLFRSIQEILEDENWSEKINLLVKITGTMLKMKTDKQFLYQASQYCPVIILCDALKTCNYLVVEQTIIFLNYLTREFPHTLQILKAKEVQKQVERAKIILTKSKIAEICQNLWERLESIDEMQTTQEDSLSYEQQSTFFFLKDKLGTSRLESFKNSLCIIHDVDSTENSRDYSDYLQNGFATARKDKKQSLKKMMSEKDKNFRRKQLKENTKKLKIKMQNLGHSKPGNRMGFIIDRILGKKVTFIFQKLLSFLWKSDV